MLQDVVGRQTVGEADRALWIQLLQNHTDYKDSTWVNPGKALCRHSPFQLSTPVIKEQFFSPFSGRETIRKDKATCEPQPLLAQTICLTPLLQIYLYVFNGKGLGSSLQLLIWSIRSRELKITITKIGLTQDPINDRESLTWDSFFPKPFTYSSYTNMKSELNNYTAWQRGGGLTCFKSDASVPRKSSVSSNFSCS